ncbi:MAG: cysteine synthase A [Anaerovoracaceae bacterium]
MGIDRIIGSTSLIQLSEKYNNIYAKLELLNPGGSVKSRIARSMIKAAEKSGELQAGGIIIEPTSGNTGIGIAMLAAAKGYKAILTMPETMSLERRKLLLSYGAEIVLTDGKLGMPGAIEKAEKLVAENKNSITLGQFTNPANPEAHYETTGPEIWEQTKGNIDIFVAGIGTGGTITGVARYLKNMKPSIRIIGIEPVESPVISNYCKENNIGIIPSDYVAKTKAPHKIQGVGAGFIPEILDLSVIDEIVRVSSEDALITMDELSKNEGVFAGISSGAAVFTATQIAKKEMDLHREKTIVTILPDTGERYLSML